MKIKKGAKGSLNGLIEDCQIFSKQDPDFVEEELSENLSGSPEILKSLARISMKRISNLQVEVSDEFLGRGESIKAVLASFMSGVPLVMLGPPGTGKSAIVRRIAAFCGLDVCGQQRGYFEYLMHSHTMPEDLFGPPNIKALQAEEPRFERITKNFLPESQIAFLDELFRGGSHILNTLLTLVNERIFHNSDGAQAVPLIGIVGAANDPPEDQELLAFYDRFPIRVWMESVFESLRDGDSSEDSLGGQLLNKSVELERQKRTEKNTTGRSQLACINDFRVAGARVSQMASESDWNRRDRRTHFDQLFQELRIECALSDRTYHALWRFACALSLLSPGIAELDDSHLKVFQYTAPTHGKLGVVRASTEKAIRMAHTGND